MSNKIPCGGFKLDNNFLGMNENDELSLTGGSEGEGKAYQQLVTDGAGTAKWEDRLAYEGSRVVVDAVEGTQYVKVTDEVPSWASIDASTKVWMNDGGSLTVTPKDNMDFGNGGFMAKFMVFFIATDNFEFNGHVFPEKGTYFIQTPEFYVSGIASADSDTPEITWDGSLYTIKQIDEKFIPSTNPNISKNYRVVFEETSRNVFQCNCTYSELKDFAVAGYPIYGVLLNRIVPTNTYSYNLIMVIDADGAHRMEFEFATSEGGTTRLYYYEDGHISNEAPIG